MELLDIVKDIEDEFKFCTLKHSKHNYIERFYEEAMLPYRDEKVDVLELGILTGGSLLMWQRYFGNANSIVGVDNSSKHFNPDITAGPGLDIFVVDDAYSKSATVQLEKFDIIIEDGPHYLDTQLECLGLFLPKLNEGGILVVESVQRVEYLEYLEIKARNVVAALDTGFDYSFDSCDLTDGGNADDVLFIVRS